MSYTSMYDLSTNQAFRNRVVAAAVVVAYHEAPLSADPAGKALGVAIVVAAEAALGLVKVICADPAFSAIEDQSALTDTQILSAVKTVWLPYARAVFPDAA